jgi:2-methylcitrate dehydratase PrpD
MTIANPTVIDRVVAFIRETSLARLPETTVERAELHLLDTLGAIVSGSTLRPGSAVGAWVHAEGGRPASSVLVHGFRTSPALAAMANGAMAHADETDDAHFSSLTHPGASIVPSVLAVAEDRGRTGAAGPRRAVSPVAIKHSVWLTRVHAKLLVPSS